SIQPSAHIAAINSDAALLIEQQKSLYAFHNAANAVVEHATIFRAVNRTTMPNMVESSSWIVVHQMYVRSGAFIFIGLIQDTCIKPWTHHPPSPFKIDTAFQSFLGWARLVIGA
ncbi:7507_t:CDS:2, partial [Funneliformis mosseae]